MILLKKKEAFFRHWPVLWGWTLKYISPYVEVNSLVEFTWAIFCHTCIHGPTRIFLIDIWNKPAISFHLFVYHKRAKREIHCHRLGKWATAWRELPFPGASFQLINNIQLDETLKDHKISLPFLSRIQASGNDLPPLQSHNTGIWEMEGLNEVWMI